MRYLPRVKSRVKEGDLNELNGQREMRKYKVSG